MILPKVLRQVSAGGGWQDQQRIDQQYTDPFDRHHHNHSGQHRKQIFHQPHRNMPAVCQRPVDAGRQQAVKTNHPKAYRHHKNHRQI